MIFKLFVIAAGFVALLTLVIGDSCVQCTSKTDVRCATDPLNYLAKDCKNTSSKCYSRIEDGYTVRGCASDLDNATVSNCNDESRCVICSFMEGCNRQVFPTHRAHCLQCSGNSTSSDCAIEVYKRPTVCPLFELGDKCYIRNTNRTGVEGSFQRGCLSSAKYNNTCKPETRCYTCQGEGCNFLAANDTQIPRDGGSLAIISLALLYGCMAMLQLL